MRPAILYCFVVIILFACRHKEGIPKLLEEQQQLKDSTNLVRESIGRYLQNGNSEGANAAIQHLNNIHARLTRIQHSIDSLNYKKNR